MKLYNKQYLAIDSPFIDLDKSAVAVMLVPYEGAVSFGKGTGKAPDAIINASAYLELYDEVLDAEIYKMGISTIAPQEFSLQHDVMIKQVYKGVKELVDLDKFVVMIGGDHSISSGMFKALYEKYPTLSCIQLDAHSDLRDSYEGSKLSHASVMARIREMTPHTLQFGIRSMCMEEAQLIKEHKINVCTMHKFRSGEFDVDRAIDDLPDPVFITVDVDAFDWSVISSTGTPEPGGFLWDEALALLHKIFMRKRVIGFDIVELSYNSSDQNSPFAAAKLIYKMLGYKLLSHEHDKTKWPQTPVGPLF